MKMLIRIALTVVLVVVVSACGGGDSGSGGSGGGLTAVTNADSADTVVRWMSDGVIEGGLFNSLPLGTHNQYSVNGGLGGTATVTGKDTYTTASSSSCVSSTRIADLTTVVFDNYKVMSSDNVEATITGTVTFYYYYYSQQCSGGYSSNKSVSISGDSVQVRFVVDGTSGYQDTISFGASGTSSMLLHGSCTAGGTTYYF